MLFSSRAGLLGISEDCKVRLWNCCLSAAQVVRSSAPCMARLAEFTWDESDKYSRSFGQCFVDRLCTWDVLYSM